MQSITQMYLKNEYLPINYGKKYKVRDFVLLNSTICNISRYGSRGEEGVFVELLD
jgi:hypothetical protein